MSAYAIAGAFPVVGTRSMKLRRFAILSSVFVCFGTTAPAFAATWVVDNDFADCPQAEFNSIQAAVLDPRVEPGDKILVCPGDYFESVTVNKTHLRIEAQAAPGEVVLQPPAVVPPAVVAQFGFHLLNTTGVLVQGFTVQSFRTANIRIESGSGNTLLKNISTLLVGPVASSIQVLNSSANVVEQNTAFANCSTCNGISVTGAASSDNIVRHNETYQNGMAGLQINGSGPRNVLFGNRSHSNTIGIRNIFGGIVGIGNVIENNYVFLNAAPTGTPPETIVSGGILVGASTFVTVRNNRSERNDAFGIRLQNGAANNLVEKNEVRENDRDGIRLETAPPGVAGPFSPVIANTVQLNLIRRNGRDGIRVFDPLATGNTFERNVIRESGEHDAHDDGTANVWINNKCETEDQPGLCKNPDD
jgi:parallel beta-helix repeat protein